MPRTRHIHKEYQLGRGLAFVPVIAALGVFVSWGSGMERQSADGRVNQLNSAGQKFERFELYEPHREGWGVEGRSHDGTSADRD